jgi:hypothetical protein
MRSWRPNFAPAANPWRGEMHDRFKAIERRLDIIIEALISGLIGLVVTNLVG